MSYWEQLLTTQGRPDVPGDERRDVNQQLLKALWSGLHFVDPQQIRAGIDYVNAQDAAVTKAVILNPARYQYAHPYPERREGHKAVLQVNDLAIMGPTGGQGWAEKPTMQSGFEFLRYFVESVDLLQAIILTLLRKAMRHFHRFDDNDGNPHGYAWVRRDGEKLTKADKKEIEYLDQVLQNSGTEFDPARRRWTYHRRTYPEFMQALVYDSLCADACPAEIEPKAARSAGIAGWYNLPFDTVRLAYEDGYQGNDAIVAVQVNLDEQAALVGFEAHEILYEVRNPRSSALLCGYGQSENECLVKAITSYLNTCTFNAAALDRNSIPRGFLTLFGEYQQAELEAFKANWNAMVRGAARRFALPVLVSKQKGTGGAQYTPVDAAGTEMFMTKWLSFLGSMGCAAHGLSPDEINLESFSSKTSSLSGDGTGERLAASHDRSLIPILAFCKRVTNALVARFTEKYVITYVGLYPEDEQRKLERQTLGLTVNEMRALDAADPHPDETIGEAPVNPTLMGLYMASKGIAQPGAEGDDEQGGGADDEDDPFSNALPDSEAPLRYARPGAQRPGSGDGSRRPGGPSSRPAFAKGGPEAPRLIVEIRELPEEHGDH